LKLVIPLRPGLDVIALVMTQDGSPTIWNSLTAVGQLDQRARRHGGQPKAAPGITAIGPS
jgi:hypothetical protein